MAEEKKVVLITGSSRGIGAALARSFAEKDYSVAINYLKSEKAAFELQETLNALFGTGTALAIRADVSHRIDVRQMFDQVYAFFNRIDVLINTAGLNIDKPFLDMTDEDWSTVLGTILTGTFICSQEFARRYQGDAGQIINIGAVTAMRGRKNGANYCCARAGILTLTKCMALELSPRIRVNCVTPGYINTQEVIERYQLDEKENLERALCGIPMNRLGTPDDVFQIIDFIVNTSSYITGQNYFVDGGSYMH
ncbi:MAG: SDR family oxidoreductase [Anaerolineales bacterium]|jgi:NAD(P)-dependent dehydrogenase (short-subunit alcohol dehydrogenase family)